MLLTILFIFWKHLLFAISGAFFLHVRRLLHPSRSTYEYIRSQTAIFSNSIAQPNINVSRLLRSLCSISCRCGAYFSRLPTISSTVNPNRLSHARLDKMKPTLLREPDSSQSTSNYSRLATFGRPSWWKLFPAKTAGRGILTILVLNWRLTWSLWQLGHTARRSFWETWRPQEGLIMTSCQHHPLR